MKKIASSIIMTFMIFTGELLKEFKHRNVADNHICNGEMKKGFTPIRDKIAISCM